MSRPHGYIILFAIVLMCSCTNDKLEPVENDPACNNISATYQKQVKAIIDSSCAYAGCHLPGGIGIGNLSSYSGILPFIKSGAFRERVFTKKNNPSLGMPPNSIVYPESKKDDLTEEELLIIQCWLNSGYPN